MASEDSSDIDEESARGLEETWFQKTSVAKFFARPCVGSSLAYGAGGLFVTSLASFGWTSNWRRAKVYGATAFAVMTLTASTVCAFRRMAEDAENESAEAKRQEQKAQREEEIRKKIEERKRRHEERKKLEQPGLVEVSAGDRT